MGKAAARDGVLAAPAAHLRPAGDAGLHKETALTRYAEAIGLVDIFEADEQLAAEALSTAIRYKHPVYDMLCVIPARRHGCRILTVDKRLIALVRQLDKSMIA